MPSTVSPRRYRYADFLPFVALSEGHKRRSALPKIKLPQQRQVTNKRDSGRLSDLANNCLAATEGERSEVDYHLCCEAVERGWSKDDVWRAVSGIGKFGERGREYFDRTWAKAEGHTRRKIYEDKVAKFEKGRKEKEGEGETVYDESLRQRRLAVLDSIKLEVLGRDSSGHYKLFSKSSNRIETIRHLEQCSYSDFCGIAGELFEQHIVRRHETESTNGKFDLKEIQQTIGTMSHGKKEIVDGEERGSGCWSSQGESGPSVVIVGARSSCEWTGEKLIKHNHPSVNGLYLDFETQYKPWYEFEELEREIKACKIQQYRETIFNELHSILKMWNWSHSSMPMTAAGVVMASWIQSLWNWRPQILISGETNSGKSTLFRALGGIYGGLALQSSQSSAAGIRQDLETSARVPLCDEFDVNDSSQKVEQKKILKMIRNAGRGSETLRGTSNQKSRHFTLRHIFWVAGTNVDLEDATDKNRFIIFELDKAEIGKENQLQLPTSDELRKLGVKVFAAALHSAFRAIELAEKLVRSTPKVDYVHSRQIESYSVPAAMVAAVTGESDEAAEVILGAMMGPVSEREDMQIRSDHETLIEDILTAHIPPRESGKKLVSQWLHDAWKNNSSDASGVLEQHGIKLSRMTAAEAAGIDGAGAGDFCLAIHPNVVKKSVLGGTQWEHSGFKHAIKGLKDFSTEGRRRIGGHNNRSVVIDFRAIGPHLEDDDGEAAGAASEGGGNLIPDDDF